MDTSCHTAHTFVSISEKYRAFREETPGGAFGAANESTLTENQSLTAYTYTPRDASHTSTDLHPAHPPNPRAP